MAPQVRLSLPGGGIDSQQEVEKGEEDKPLRVCSSKKYFFFKKRNEKESNRKGGEKR